MNIKFHFLITLFLAAAFLNTAAHGEPLPATKAACPNGEKVYFSCKTKRSKLISLCGKEINNRISSLTYYFGNLDTPELTISASSKRHFEPFWFNHYFRSGVDYARINFIRGDYRYEIYSSYNMEETPEVRSGIIVSSQSKPDKRTHIECVKDITINLTPLFPVLNCDEESALGCSN